MENLLRKGHCGIISQLNVIHAVEKPSVHPEIQYILFQHQVVFKTPQGHPPSPGVHDHSIPLVLSSVPPNFHPYHQPFTQKNDIEKIVQELLEFDVIHPSIYLYSSIVVMVLNKKRSWCMCPYFRALNKLNTKEKFPIPFNDELLDELSGSRYFTFVVECYTYQSNKGEIVKSPCKIQPLPIQPTI
jgi:hypothetical protein